MVGVKIEVKQKPPDLKVKTEPDTLMPLVPPQTEGVIRGLIFQKATFFNWEEFQRLTKDLPPSTLITDILKSLRREK